MRSASQITVSPCCNLRMYKIRERNVARRDFLARELKRLSADSEGTFQNRSNTKRQNRGLRSPSLSLLFYKLKLFLNTETSLCQSLIQHLYKFVLVINQLDAQNLFYKKFISCLYMFRAPCAHRQEVKNCIIQHLVSSHSVGGRRVHRLREESVLPQPVQRTATYRPVDTRGCIIQF